MKNLGTLAAGDHIQHLAWDAEGTRCLITPATGPILIADEKAAQVGEQAGHGMGNGASDWFHGEPATCGYDGKIRWGRQVWTPGRGVIERVRTSPDGELLAAAQGRTLPIFDAQGAVDKSLRGLATGVADFCWNPAALGEIALAGAGGAVLWRLGEEEPFARFDWGGASLSVAWSADGRWIATGDQSPSVHVYDIPRDHPLHIQGFDAKVRAMAFSADGRRLATSGGAVVTVWPCTGQAGPEGAEPIQIDGSESEVMAVAFSPATGQLATGDATGTLLVIGLEKGQLRRKRARFAGGISALAWHPSRPLLAIGHASGEVLMLSLE